jgi:hypothetical protein
MPVHPDPNKKLFGFRLYYATGQTDFGLIVAKDKQDAWDTLRGLSFCAVEYDLIIDDQPAFVETILSQYNGAAFLTTEPSCN